MTTRRDETTRERDHLDVGDLVWVLEPETLLYEGRVERVADSFTYRDGETRPLGYHVRIAGNRYRSGNLDFFVRSRLFRKPTELRELISTVEENLEIIEAMLTELKVDIRDHCANCGPKEWEVGESDAEDPLNYCLHDCELADAPVTESAGQ